MAEKGGSSLEWYLVSVSKLKLIAGILILALLGLGIWYFQTEIAGSPSSIAQRAIEDAERSLNELAGIENLEEFRSDFERANLLLVEAKDAFSSGTFATAEATAGESHNLSRSVLSRVQGEAKAAAQILTVEGSVEYQRSGGAFRNAVPRTSLQKGDWIRTGGSSSAELFFSNGSLYTVGADALLEIYPPTSSRSRSQTVKMEVGTIHVNTADDRSSVSTPATEIVVESASETLVDVEEDGDTEVASIRGTTSVSASGGNAVSLAKGQKVTATDQGDLSEVRPYALPPALGAPADNAVIAASEGRIITLEWRDLPSARAYRLQVSRSRLFGHLEIDATRSESEARVRLTSSGSFFWRVATIDQDGSVGPFSDPKRFRVTGIGDAPASGVSGDTTPPSLEITAINHLGGPSYQIVGQAEPGASVFINEQAIRVGSDGSFRHLITFNRVGYNTVVIKATDPAGNQTIERERINVQD